MEEMEVIHKLGELSEHQMKLQKPIKELIL
jgi:hypothetical protein